MSLSCSRIPKNWRWRHRNELCRAKKRIHEITTQARISHWRNSRTIRMTRKNGSRNAKSPSASEDGAADADDRRSLFDRDLEVIGHPHGEMCKTKGLFDFSQLPEVRSYRLGLTDGRDRHQTQERERIDSLDRGSHAAHLCGIDTRLLRFPPDVDLDQHVLTFAGRSGRPAHSLGELAGVDRMNRVEQTHGVLRLVRLQMTDQMPPSCARNSWLLVARFLHAVFADIRGTGGDRRIDRHRGKRLRHRHERDLFPTAGSPVTGGHETTLDRGQVREDLFRTQHRGDDRGSGPQRGPRPHSRDGRHPCFRLSTYAGSKNGEIAAPSAWPVRKAAGDSGV